MILNELQGLASRLGVSSRKSHPEFAGQSVASLSTVRKRGVSEASLPEARPLSSGRTSLDDAVCYGVGIETGKRFAAGGPWSLTPSATCLYACRLQLRGQLWSERVHRGRRQPARPSRRCARLSHWQEPCARTSMASPISITSSSTAPQSTLAVCASAASQTSCGAGSGSAGLKLER